MSQIESNALESALGTVAIIGRPNVGKSTLFNILTNTRRAVVKDQPGVTRDIQILPGEWCSRHFNLMDTGGLTDQQDSFSPLIKRQVEEALSFADLVLVVVDGRVGLCPEDRDVVRMVQKLEKPYRLIVNKVDSRVLDTEYTMEFYELDSQPIAASFENRRGLDDILEWVIAHLPKQTAAREKRLTLAVVGKPNVGKSSFCNFLSGYSRMIVSEIAGTTVDAIDMEIQYKDQVYHLVDTAGLRKKAKRKEDVEILSAFKSQEALRKADIILLFVDATEGPTEQDAKIVEMVLEKHKGVILVANKSDLAQKEIPAFRSKFHEKKEIDLHFFDDIPTVFISAKTGGGIEELFKTINTVWEKLNFRIGTGELNRFFMEAIRRAPSPVHGTKNVSFYYLTQTQQRPPSFIAFANYPEGVNPAYRRFLARQIKKEWKLEGIPIRIFAMRRGGNSLSR